MDKNKVISLLEENVFTEKPKDSYNGIIDFILDRPASRCTEKYIKKNYFNLYLEVLNYSIKNSLESLLRNDKYFNQLLYHYINDITSIIKCNNKECNNIVDYRNISIGYRKYCCSQCVINEETILLKKETMKKNGGNSPWEVAYKNGKTKTDHPFNKSKDEIRLKIKQKYGIDNVFQLEKVKEKIKKTNLERRGVEYISQSKEIRDKIKNTSIKKYGVSHPNQSEKIRNKIKNSHLNRDKEEIQTSNIKRKNTCNDKYQVDYNVQFGLVKDKIKKSLIEKYGVDNPTKSKYITDKIKDNNLKKSIIRIKEKYDNLNILSIDLNRNIKILCDKCNNEYSILLNFLYLRVIRYKVTPCIHCNPVYSYSDSQKSIYDFILSIDTLISITVNDRSVISPKELDVYLPDYKLAFEFNGVYWHNELYRDKNYHLTKTELAIKNDITLIHIWEDDWTYMQDIIKSRILNLLNKTLNRIYSRKCRIKEVSFKESNQFLEDNHLQGKCVSKYNIGLYYGEELVSLMTFGNKRKSLGQVSKNGEYELLRFCNKLNTSVIGAASKLFKYFVEEYTPIKIISYANRCWTNAKDNNLYIKLGFEYVSTSRPNYWYVVDGVRRHRFNFRKDKLIAEGYDSNMTEHDIMISRNIYRVYDCGNYKFEWNNLKKIE